MVKDAVPLQQCARALVIKLRHHGDVLLDCAVISLVKNREGRMEVDALVYDGTAAMLEGHPALSRMFLVGRGWKGEGLFSRFSKERELFGEMRDRRYDIVVHLSEQPRGAWLARSLGARYSVAPAMPGRGRFWTNSFTHLYPIAPRRHQVEVNLDALRRIGVQPSLEERKVLFVPGAEAQARVEKLVEGGPFIHIHPASRWRFKCWPAEKNAALIDRFSAQGHKVVVTAAPDADELSLIDEIVGKTKTKPLSLAGKLSIKELGALAARARLFVGVDSMPMHLAAAIGTPTVALFGPSGELEWGPWNVAHRVVISAPSCPPCGLDGCGGGKVSDCLATLTVDRVHAAALELFSN